MLQKNPCYFCREFLCRAGQNPENLRVYSIVGCVKLPEKYRFLQKIPVFPCFLFHTVCVLADFVCDTGYDI